VLSELLGDVGDEFKAGEPVAEALPDGRVRLPGQMPVEDAATYLGTKWETGAATVNGLVTEALGHLPTPGERVVLGDFEFEVEDVRRRALVTARVRRVKREPAEEAPQ
jgi:CBS domain containing-hemolysin-like protein